MTAQESQARLEIIAAEMIDERREALAMSAIHRTFKHSHRARVAKEARVHRGFTFDLPPDFVIPKPLDPNFPWNFLGSLPGTSASSSGSPE
jgi:hypothetical protein